MSTVGPVDHIARRALPWRTEPQLTECGKPIGELGDRVVSREVIRTRVKDVGKQRAAFTTCMTCWSTSDRWTGETEEHDLITTVSREVNALQHAAPPRPVHFQYRETALPRDRDVEMWERHQHLARELRAIAALVEAHRDEFDGYLAGLADTVNLADRRRRQVSGGHRV